MRMPTAGPIAATEASDIPRHSLADVVSDVNGARELANALSSDGFAVVSLPEADASILSATLSTISRVLEPLHGCSPRTRRHTGAFTSTWARRILMNYIPDDEPQADNEAPALKEAVAAAAAVHPLLLRISRAATDGMDISCPLSNGRLDAFFYPDDEVHCDCRDYEDVACPCPSHTDPGIVTVVAETSAALEAISTAGGPWRRLDLRHDEVCIVTGQTLAKLSGGAFKACEHRVSPTSAPRASYVFEVHARVQPEEPDASVKGAADVAVDVRGRREWLGARAARLLAWLQVVTMTPR